MKYTAILITFLIFTVSLSAQKKVSVTAQGSYEARDLTLEEVKQKAIDEAKRNAMIKAGISENVQVSDFLYTFEDDEKFQEIFQSFISTETGAEIIVEEVKELNRDINEFGNILIEVEIDAIIFKHKEKKDLTFKFRVDGIGELYYEDDPVSFSFTPTKDGYLKIFNVTDQTSSVLYPYKDIDNSYLNDDPERLFNKNEKINFPVNKNMDYYFEISDKQKDKEYNLLIFVYTKENISFWEEPNVNNIMEWIYEIPIDSRYVEQFGIALRNK